MAKKVIFHINEPSRLKFLIPNLKNILNDEEAKGSKIKVLANGPIVIAFDKTETDNNEVLKEIASLSSKGIEFLACGNALSKLGVKESNLQEDIRIVPAGVTELMKRQAEGYSYIKP